MRALAIACTLFISAAAPAAAETIDMSTMTCKQFLDNGTDRITLLLAWLDGFYSKSDDAKLDTDAYGAKVKGMLAFCRANADATVEDGAEKVFGKK